MITADEVKALLEQRLRAPGTSRPSVWTVEGPRIERPSSLIFVARCAGHDAPLAVKAVRNEMTMRPWPERATVEYTSNVYVQERFPADEQFRVMRAYAHLKDRAVLVCEWVRGRNAMEIMALAEPDDANMRDVMRRCGTWLARFHAINKRAPMPMPGHKVVDKLEQKTAGVSAEKRAHPILAEVLSALRGRGDMVSSIPLPFGLRHGDFKPDNIMMEGPVTVGIDITYEDESHAIIFDLARFINYMLLICFAKDGYLPHFESIRDTFLAGYADYADLPDRRVLVWQRLRNNINFYLDGPPDDPPNPEIVLVTEHALDELRRVFPI